MRGFLIVFFYQNQTGIKKMASIGDFHGFCGDFHGF